MIYEIKDDKIIKSSKTLTEKSHNLICILSKKEWEEYPFINSEYNEKVHFCKIEDKKKYMYGTLFIPIKEKFANYFSIYFYLYNDNLILIDNEDIINELLQQIINTKSKSDYNIIKLFHDILEVIIKEDLSYLENLETKLSILEDKIMENKADNFNKAIIKTKKEIIRFYHYYNQILDMMDILIDSDIAVENIFSGFIERISRLQSEALLLREYTQELQSLYETQISLRQNDVMKILTIVTTIFLPLTLITGWYGMNFKYMPELTWEFGYPMIFIVFALIVIICLIIFKKKKFW